MFKFGIVVEYHVINKLQFVLLICSHVINILLAQVHLKGFVPLVCLAHDFV